MMRSACSMPAMLAMLAAMLPASPAHAQVTLGRLFATPAERAQMEATRGGSAALLPNSQGTAPAAGSPGGPPPAASASGIPSGVQIYTSASGGGAGPISGVIGPSASAPAAALPAGPAGGPAGVPAGAPAGSPPAAGAGPTPAGASSLTMTGVLRSSDNRTVVFLNGVPQSGPQNKLSRSANGAPDVTVTLPSGRKITLKAGQRYDLNESRIKDVNEQ